MKVGAPSRSCWIMVKFLLHDHLMACHKLQLLLTQDSLVNTLSRHLVLNTDINFSGRRLVLVSSTILRYFRACSCSRCRSRSSVVTNRITSSPIFSIELVTED
ncbi:unnamed protein product [Amoebophrya sp. A25]|nr:unnamed protein product [Amoebophrya sp. A25]|eukprot:GSA25T00019998001.1